MSENEWQKLCSESDLKESIPAAFDLGKNRVLAIRQGTMVHACGGKCTHYGAPLEQGFLRGHILTCPWHNAKFDIATGKTKAAPALTHLKHYEARIEGGDVYVRPIAAPAPRIRTETAGQTILILGSGAAGNAAAETLRDEGFAGRLILISPEDALPYDRPNLSKDFLAGKAKPEWIPLHSRKFYDDRNIQFIHGKATAVDAAARTITLDSGEKLSWDRLLLATGARPRPLSIPGANKKGVFLLRSRADSEDIVKALEGARSAAVIGASFIGLEAASALRSRGLEVCVIGPESIPLGKVFGEQIGAWLQGIHESQGVKFHLGRTPVEVTGGDSVEGIRLDDGTLVTADVVIAGIGVTPVLDYLPAAGIVSGNAVPVDSCLRTSLDGIFAAGDIAAVPYAPIDRRIRVEHWAVAQRQGQHAARAMLGSKEPFGEIPFFWTRQHEMSLCYLGWAAAYDRIVFRGAFGKEGFLAGFYEKGTLRAVVSLRRSTDLNILGELLKDGIAVSPDVFADEKTALQSLLPEQK